jgi:hypothetical protein
MKLFGIDNQENVYPPHMANRLSRIINPLVTNSFHRYQKKMKM